MVAAALGVAWCYCVRMESSRGPQSARASRVASAAAGSLLAGALACSGTLSRPVIRITGSDTMVNLIQAWAEHYKDVRPAVSVQVSGGGSGVGIAGLIDGTVDIAAASREMKAAERRSARARNGAEPREVTVAQDALAVYVHKDNPLASISIADLAEIYGERGWIVKWSQLGIANRACPSDFVIRVGRQNNSGTYAYVRDVVLGPAREYKMGSIDQSGSKDVVALVSRTPCAIGYSGMAFATAGVKVLKIAAREGAGATAPSEKAVIDRSYPLARPLYLYSAKQPADQVKEFLAWALGNDGQQIVRDVGFVPAPSPDSASFPRHHE